MAHMLTRAESLFRFCPILSKTTQARLAAASASSKPTSMEVKAEGAAAEGRGGDGGRADPSDGVLPPSDYQPSAREVPSHPPHSQMLPFYALLLTYPIAYRTDPLASCHNATLTISLPVCCTGPALWP
jgi:hypothetical protein